MTPTLLALLTGWMLGGTPRVVIDPGHGGDQSGATSPEGVLEKNLALALARKVKSLLEAELHATVVLTRDKDAPLGLPERVALANRNRPDLFLSIHLNSMPTRRQRLLTEGIETYFLSASASGEEARSVAARENAEVAGPARGPGSDTLSFILADLQRAEAHTDSSRLAYAIHEALIAGTGAPDRGVQQAPFFVLMGLEAPAVLVELGFISHPDETRKLTDPGYQQRLAGAVASGVKRFLAELEARDGRKTSSSTAP
jgi:N-acetylmuramoyl-L-alanine amidase